MEDASVKKFHFTWTMLLVLASFSLCLTEISGHHRSPGPGRNFNKQPMGFFGRNHNKFHQQSMFQNQGNPRNYGHPRGYGNPNAGYDYFPSQNYFQNFGRPDELNQYPNNFNNEQQPFGQSSFPNNVRQAFLSEKNGQPAPQHQRVNGDPDQPGFGHRNPTNVQNRPEPNQGPSNFNNENPTSGQNRPELNQGQDNFPNPYPEGRYPNRDNPTNEHNVLSNVKHSQNRPSAVEPESDYGWHWQNPGDNGNNEKANKSNQVQGPDNFPKQSANPHKNFNNGNGNGHSPEVNKPIDNSPNTETQNQEDRHMQTTDPPIDVRLNLRPIKTTVQTEI